MGENKTTLDTLLGKFDGQATAVDGFTRENAREALKIFNREDERYWRKRLRAALQEQENP